MIFPYIFQSIGSFYLTSGVSASVASSMVLANSPVRSAAQSNGGQSQSNPSHMLYYSPNVSVSQISNKPNEALNRANQLPSSSSSSSSTSTTTSRANANSTTTDGASVPPFLYLSRRHNHNHNHNHTHNNNYNHNHIHNHNDNERGQRTGLRPGSGPEQSVCLGECLAVNTHGDAVYCGYVLQPDKSNQGALRSLPCRMLISATR